MAQSTVISAFSSDGRILAQRPRDAGRSARRCRADAVLLLAPKRRGMKTSGRARSSGAIDLARMRRANLEVDRHGQAHAGRRRFNAYAGQRDYEALNKDGGETNGWAYPEDSRPAASDRVASEQASRVVVTIAGDHRRRPDPPSR